MLDTSPPPLPSLPKNYPKYATEVNKIYCAHIVPTIKQMID